MSEIIWLCLACAVYLTHQGEVCEAHTSETDTGPCRGCGQYGTREPRRFAEVSA